MHEIFLINSRKNLIRNATLYGLFLFLLQGTLLLGAAWLDDNFYINGNGLGLFEHRGIIVILLGDLFILIAVALLLNTSLKMTRKVPIKKFKKSNTYLKRSEKVLIRNLSFKTPFKYITYFTFIVAFIFWLNNAYQTTLPEEFYGNDVYDSSKYIYSYIVTRFILGTSWLFLYPIAIHYSLGSCFILFKFFKNLNKNKRLDFNVFHPDRCGGFSFFGELNFYFVVIILILYVELSMVLFTHGQWNIGIVAGFVFTSVILIVGSIFFIYPIIQYLNRKKSYLIGSYYRKLKQADTAKNILLYHLVKDKITYSPYHNYQKVTISLARLGPVVTLIAKVLF